MSCRSWIARFWIRSYKPRHSVQGTRAKSALDANRLQSMFAAFANAAGIQSTILGRPLPCPTAFKCLIPLQSVPTEVTGGE